MLLQLAYRNILRNKRRSLLTVSAMVFSSSMLLLALGVSAGKMGDMLASATEQYHGHLVLSRTGYQPQRDMYAHFAPEDGMIRRILEHPGVRGVSPRLRAFGLLSQDTSTIPVEALGIRPEAEATVTTLQQCIVRGAGFDSSGNGCLLGTGMARKLNVAPGDAIAFVTRGADGSIGNDLLTVKGIFETGNTRNDNQLVLTELPWLQQVTALDSQIHELAIAVRAPMQAAGLARQMRDDFGNDYTLQDWSVFLPEIRDAIIISHVSNSIIMAIFYMATALCIFNTFYMSVMERTREFGVLLALGMRPGQLRAMVLCETLLLGGTAVLAGMALGFCMNWYMQDIGVDLSGHVSPISYGGGTILPRVRAVIEPVRQTGAALMLLLVCPVAGFVPANMAARCVPIKALRGE